MEVRSITVLLDYSGAENNEYLGNFVSWYIVTELKKEVTLFTPYI